jgi:hypothetical protein
MCVGMGPAPIARMRNGKPAARTAVELPDFPRISMSRIV